ncbi:hypothetical protein B7P43_G17454 [Cryptotermes secundus]|uniref:Histone-lysine N-methyltransferase SETMAR n=1 Tax=Cryptotermes secundus TaxID=105785 RepID=A0A2J7RCZ1_9NEOP|nr:hypothetical protein B7P43_G17454 [Cryptotermes secundus]
MIIFYGEELLAPHPTPKLEDHPLLAVCDCLFNIFAASLQNNKTAVVPHPLYLPDVAPYDSFLFPKMKIKLMGRRFDTVEEIQAEMQTVLNTLTKKDFQDAFQKW